jgi:membrane-anchored protein YejM (alkaline phosphatase superfamily)
MPHTGHQSLMRRVYYGCLSYVDNLIGQALAMLDAEDVASSTVVSWIGDHGWHLGEHDMWCKMSTLELGTRIPMLIRAPWITSAINVTTQALAEAVDLWVILMRHTMHIVCDSRVDVCLRLQLFLRACMRVRACAHVRVKVCAHVCV